MFCKKCNNKLEVDHKFCDKCGTEVNLAGTVKAVSVPTTPVPGRRKVRWWAWFVLGIVLDSAGTGLPHDSTLGNLFTIFGACFIIASIVEGIRGHKRRKSANNTELVNEKMKRRSITEIVIIVITILILFLWVAIVSLDKAREKASIAMCPGLVSSAQDDKWVVYYSAMPHFCGKFPSYPVHDATSTDTSNGPAQVDSYKSVDDTGSIMYVINVTGFPATTNLTDANAALDRSIDFSANNMNEKVISADHITYDGYPALDYVVQGSSASKIRGLNVLVGQRLYQLLAAYDPKDEAKLEFDKFLTQFTIL